MPEPTWRIIAGDCRDTLATLPERSVQTCVTSPPYFGLRDYGTGEWEGGDPGCDHRGAPQQSPRSTLAGNGHGPGRLSPALQAQSAPVRECRCGARRVDRQIGLEPSPDEFVAALVEVFRAVRRVLRDDGTVWLNLGDTYASKARGSDEGWDKSRLTNPGTLQKAQAAALRPTGERHRGKAAGVKEKDLIGIPWMVAFALRADGWYLRSDIIWAKPNPMPESVTDRPTKAHEYLFLLSKGPRYFYDADAIAEASVIGEGAVRNITPGNKGAASTRNDGDRFGVVNDGTRNRRSVWTVATQPYAGAHFATFPPKLIEPCILAGTSPKVCGECGAPWRRVTERTPMVVDGGPKREAFRAANPRGSRTQIGGNMTAAPTSRTVGWEPTCDHDDDSGACTVLDPFSGSGTTGMVALRHGRSYVGCELNPEYVELARRRIVDDAPLLNTFAEEAAA
jgi:DNA modification methylase